MTQDLIEKGLEKVECPRCHGMKNIMAPCPDGQPGCLVLHTKPCDTCNAGGFIYRRIKP